MEPHGTAERVQLPPAGGAARLRPDLRALLLARRVAGGGRAAARTRAGWHGIPGVLIHGRLDMGSPLGTAWELAQAWPDARLVVVDDSGHTGSETMRDEILDTLDRFARR